MLLLGGKVEINVEKIVAVSLLPVVLLGTLLLAVIIKSIQKLERYVSRRKGLYLRAMICSNCKGFFSLDYEPIGCTEDDRDNGMNVY